MKAYRIDKWRALPHFTRFLKNPITTTRDLHERFGPFIQLEFPHSTSAKPRAVSFIADPELYKTLISDPETWRNIKVNPRARRNHAADRLTKGMTRLRGARHEHYRKLIAPPLKRAAVSAMSPDMARIADARVKAWPRDIPVGLTETCRDMAKHLGIGLLFGNDMQRALPITAMISRMLDASWLIPGMEYVRWIREADAQERAIVEWAYEKRGQSDAQDFLSILINNNDENGDPPTPEILGGLTSFLFAAAYDTCQNGLAWTLLLLTQHPEIMADLTEEITGAIGQDYATMDRVGILPLLDSIIKESMRLLPPVPLMMRKATRATALGDAAIPAGERALISAFIINRAPSLYPDPDRFEPGRWAGIKPSPFQYTTFGAGGQMCPGVTFGMQMMKIGLAAILANTRVELAPNSDVGYRTRVMLAPYGRAEVIFRDPGNGSAYRPVAGLIRGLLDLPQVA